MLLKFSQINWQTKYLNDPSSIHFLVIIQFKVSGGLKPIPTVTVQKVGSIKCKCIGNTVASQSHQGALHYFSNATPSFK